MWTILMHTPVMLTYDLNNEAISGKDQKYEFNLV